MGANETKFTKIPKLKEPAIEVTSAWSLHESLNPSNASVFFGPNKKPLTNLVFNLKTHRHPFILRYGDSNINLITEEVLPLSQVIRSQTALQILIGLYNVASAGLFLHETAQSSHNNICLSSIYVTSDCNWKLAGLEYLTRFKDTTTENLRLTREFRYQKGIPPEASKKVISTAIDIYGFGVLCEEVLSNLEDLPYLEEFLNYVNDKLKDVAEKRPSFREILEQPFFQHDIIKIHQFLLELPLRSAPEKLEFFKNLERHLRSVPEVVIGTQLLSLLLSRVVLLDVAAQTHLLPILLKPGVLFSEDNFKKFVTPKLLQIFCVRDTAIRLLLLSYLKSWLDMFSQEELQVILPQLLVGIKDNNDELVAETLRALADLVLVLGADVVVGGRRSRVFSDGRPDTCRPIIENPVKSEKDEEERNLPERPSPDGGEDGEWHDWNNSQSVPIQTEVVKVEVEQHVEEKRKTPRNSVRDFLELDIKSSANKGGPEEDFFRDMEPEISKPARQEPALENKFTVNESVAVGGEGWEDSFSDWPDE